MEQMVIGIFYDEMSHISRHRRANAPWRHFRRFR